MTPHIVVVIQYMTAIHSEYSFSFFDLSHTRDSPGSVT